MELLTELALHQHPMTDISWGAALPEELDLLEVNQRSSITG